VSLGGADWEGVGGKEAAEIKQIGCHGGIRVGGYAHPPSGGSRSESKEETAAWLGELKSREKK